MRFKIVPLFVLSTLLVAIPVFPEFFIKLLPKSEIRYVSYLFFKRHAIEQIAIEASETGLERVWWIKDSAYIAPIADLNGVEPQKPFNDKIVDIAESAGLHGVFLLRDHEGWEAVPGLDDYEDGFNKYFSAYYGNIPNELLHCDNVELGVDFEVRNGYQISICYGELFDSFLFKRVWVKEV